MPLIPRTEKELGRKASPTEKICMEYFGGEDIWSFASLENTTSGNGVTDLENELACRFIAKAGKNIPFTEEVFKEMFPEEIH